MSLQHPFSADSLLSSPKKTPWKPYEESLENRPAKQQIPFPDFTKVPLRLAEEEKGKKIQSSYESLFSRKESEASFTSMEPNDDLPEGWDPHNQESDNGSVFMHAERPVFNMSESQIWKHNIQCIVENAGSSLYMHHHNLTMIPSEISDLNTIIRLPLAAKKFTRSKTLESLFFHRDFTRSPSSTTQVGPVQFTLNFGHNQITGSSISFALFSITNITVLSFFNNPLGHLPPGIGRLVNLKSLNVANTGIRYLPSEIANLKLLERLTLSLRSMLRPSEHEKRVGRLIIHYTVPTLAEILQRLLLEPIPTSSSSKEAHRVIHNVAPTSNVNLDRKVFSNFWTSTRLPNGVNTLAESNGIKSLGAIYDPLANICRCSPVEGPTKHFIQPAVERYIWVNHRELTPAGDFSPTTETPLKTESLVPLLFRGCSLNCLDNLDN